MLCITINGEKDDAFKRHTNEKEGTDMTSTKEKNMMSKVEGNEIFEVFDFCGEKKILKMGFFSKVYGESKPYAWYTSKTPVIDIDKVFESIVDDLGSITLMTADEVSEKLSEMQKLTPLDMMDVSKHTPCGFYYGL